MTFNLADIIIIFGCFIISHGEIVPLDSVSSEIDFPTIHLSNDIFKSNRYAVVNSGVIISSNIYSSIISGSLIADLNRIEASEMIYLIKNSTLQCQGISENPEERRILEALDSRINLMDYDKSYPGYIISKVASCLSNNYTSDYNLIPRPLIPSRSTPLIHNSIHYSLGSIDYEEMRYDMTYWDAVLETLDYEVNNDDFTANQISESKLSRIKLISDEHLTSGSLELNKLSQNFTNFWFSDSDNDILGLNNFMINIRIGESRMESMMQYVLTKQRHSKCDSYSDMFETYSSICSYYFYINWRLGRLSNIDYFRYRYSSVFDIRKMDIRRSCMIYAGHIPGFNNRFVNYDRYYLDYEFRHNYLQIEQHLNDILSNLDETLEIYTNEKHTRVADELVMIFSNNQHKNFYFRNLSMSIANLVLNNTVCRSKA